MFSWQRLIHLLVHTEMNNSNRRWNHTDKQQQYHLKNRIGKAFHSGWFHVPTHWLNWKTWHFTWKLASLQYNEYTNTMQCSNGHQNKVSYSQNRHFFPSIFDMHENDG